MTVIYGLTTVLRTSGFHYTSHANACPAISDMLRLSESVWLVPGTATGDED